MMYDMYYFKYSHKVYKNLHKVYKMLHSCEQQNSINNLINNEMFKVVDFYKLSSEVDYF